MSMTDIQLETKDFLLEAKNAIGDNWRFTELLRVLELLKEKRISITTYVAKMSDILYGHKKLVEIHNIHVPPAFRLHLDIPVSYSHALEFCKRVHNRDSGLFVRLSECLRKFEKDSLRSAINDLLSPYPELLAEISLFINLNSSNENIIDTSKEEIISSNTSVSLSPSESATEKSLLLLNNAIKKTLETTTEVPPNDQTDSLLMQQALQCFWSFTSPSSTSATTPASTPDSLPHSQDLIFFSDLRIALCNDEIYMEVLKLFLLYIEGVLCVYELYSLLDDIFPIENLYLVEKCKKMILQREPARRYRSFFCIPLSHINFSNTTFAGTSYRLLPNNYPKQSCLGRVNSQSAIELNDQWISIPHGSEDYSFRLMRKNSYEEMLFRCEDDQYELDLLIESAAATIIAFDEIFKKLSLMNLTDRMNARLPLASISPIYLRTLGRIYGDYSEEARELLSRTPFSFLPIILERMRKKHKEWIEAKKSLELTVWKGVKEKNYPRSFDHRSFYFQQVEKKNILLSTMILDVRERSQRRRLVLFKKQLRMIEQALMGIDKEEGKEEDRERKGDRKKEDKERAEEMCMSLLRRCFVLNIAGHLFPRRKANLLNDWQNQHQTSSQGQNLSSSNNHMVGSTTAAAIGGSGVGATGFTGGKKNEATKCVPSMEDEEFCTLISEASLPEDLPTPMRRLWSNEFYFDENANTSSPSSTLSPNVTSTEQVLTEEFDSNLGEIDAQTLIDAIGLIRYSVQKWCRNHPSIYSIVNALLLLIIRDFIVCDRGVDQNGVTNDLLMSCDELDTLLAETGANGPVNTVPEDEDETLNSISSSIRHSSRLHKTATMATNTSINNNTSTGNEMVYFGLGEGDPVIPLAQVLSAVSAANSRYDKIGGSVRSDDYAVSPVISTVPGIVTPLDGTLFRARTDEWDTVLSRDILKIPNSCKLEMKLKHQQNYLHSRYENPQLHSNEHEEVMSFYAQEKMNLQEQESKRRRSLKEPTDDGSSPFHSSSPPPSAPAFSPINAEAAAVDINLSRGLDDVQLQGNEETSMSSQWYSRISTGTTRFLMLNDLLYGAFKQILTLASRLKKGKLKNPSDSIRIEIDSYKSIVVSYPTIVHTCHRLLKGEINTNTFETTLRLCMYNDAYLLFTLEKLVLNCSRLLIACTHDIQSRRLISLYLSFRHNEVSVSSVKAYERAASVICYPHAVFSNKCHVEIGLVETMLRTKDDYVSLPTLRPNWISPGNEKVGIKESEIDKQYKEIRALEKGIHNNKYHYYYKNYDWSLETFVLPFFGITRDLSYEYYFNPMVSREHQPLFNPDARLHKSVLCTRSSNLLDSFMKRMLYSLHSMLYHPSVLCNNSKRQEILQNYWAQSYNPHSLVTPYQNVLITSLFQLYYISSKNPAFLMRNIAQKHRDGDKKGEVHRKEKKEREILGRIVHNGLSYTIAMPTLRIIPMRVGSGSYDSLFTVRKGPRVCGISHTASHSHKKRKLDHSARTERFYSFWEKRLEEIQQEEKEGISKTPAVQNSADLITLHDEAPVAVIAHSGSIFSSQMNVIFEERKHRHLRYYQALKHATVLSASNEEYYKKYIFVGSNEDDIVQSLIFTPYQQSISATPSTSPSIPSVVPQQTGAYYNNFNSILRLISQHESSMEDEEEILDENEMENDNEMEQDNELEHDNDEDLMDDEEFDDNQQDDKDEDIQDDIMDDDDQSGDYY